MASGGVTGGRVASVGVTGGGAASVGETGGGAASVGETGGGAASPPVFPTHPFTSFTTNTIARRRPRNVNETLLRQVSLMII